MKRMILKMNGISGIVETMGAIFSDRGGKVTHLLHIYFVSVFCMKEKSKYEKCVKKGPVPAPGCVYDRRCASGLCSQGGGYR